MIDLKTITTIQWCQIQLMFGMYFSQLLFPEIYQEIYSVINEPQLPEEYTQYLMDQSNGVEILIVTGEPLYKQLQWINSYFVEYIIIDKYYNPSTDTSYIQIRLKESYK